MADPEHLNELSRLIDQAYYYAVQTSQDMSAFVLAIASQEVAERLEEIERRRERPE